MPIIPKHRSGRQRERRQESLVQDGFDQLSRILNFHVHFLRRLLPLFPLIAFFLLLVINVGHRVVRFSEIYSVPVEAAGDVVSADYDLLGKVADPTGIAGPDCVRVWGTRLREDALDARCEYLWDASAGEDGGSASGEG